jgi:hypothetical protein
VGPRAELSGRTFERPADGRETGWRAPSTCRWPGRSTNGSAS